MLWLDIAVKSYLAGMVREAYRICDLDLDS